MREAISKIRRERAASLGLIAGALLSILGVSVYLVRPLLTREQQSSIDVLALAAFRMTTYPLWHHVIVIVLPSFIVSLVGMLLLNRWGLTGKAPTLKFLGGVTGVPFTAILLAYFVAAIVIGVGFGAGAGENPLSAVFGVFVFTGLSFALGAGFVAVALGIVIPCVILGATAGYLVARGLSRLSDYPSTG